MATTNRQAALYFRRARRRAMSDPTSRLFRTHRLTVADSDIDTAAAFGDSDSRLQPVTFAFALSRSGASEGLVFEFGSEDRGVAVWVDGADVGVCAGAGETASADDGVTLLAEDALPVCVASGVLTLTGNAQDGETVSIGGKTYTFQDTLTDVDGNVLIGASASDSLDNLIAAINLDAGAGTLYADSTTEHPTVSAQASAGDTMTVTAKNAGSVANLILTTETLANGSWAAATLRGGLEPLRFVLSIIPGTGTVELFRNGQRVAGGQAAGGSFGGGWADDDNGAIGAVQGTVIDRVPVGSQIALAQCALVGAASVYLHQRAGI